MDKATSRLRVLALLVVLMFLALTARLWFLQVLAAQTFDKDARNNSVRWMYSEPERGQILDARGRELVVNQNSLEVRITPDQLGDRAEAVVLNVSELTGVAVQAIAKELQSSKYVSSQAIPVAEFVPEEVELYIKEHAERFPGVDVVQTSVRRYPFDRMAAHLFGYVHLIDQDRLKLLQDHGYDGNDNVGFGGLEEQYELYLHGDEGKRKLIVNSDGDVLKLGAEIPPTPGDDLHLTLDARIQRVVERSLLAGMARARSYHDENGNALRADAGAVVVLDADTGGVVAMASEPGYNPEWWVRGLTPAQSKYLFKNQAVAPSLDRAIQADYTPGSTFKPITGLAAIKDGIASMSGAYHCSTTYRHPGDTSGASFSNWAPSDVYMSIATALRVSCDTVFDRFGSSYYFRWRDDQLSQDPLEKRLHEWGFEQPTGIDMPAEITGLVPDPAWASTRPDLFEGGAWIPGGDILTMIGSGYVQVTPLQLARAYAAIANGGHLCQPHLVDEITSGVDASLVKRVTGHCDETVPYSAQELAYIRSALRSVVTGGTAQCAFQGFPFSKVSVAGKTGTAERESNKQDTSWFASMVGPDPEHPDYVIVTMVEQGGFGGQTAAPITREIVGGLYPDIDDTSHLSCRTPDR